MNIVGKVVCKTVGIAALSAAVYDSYMEGRHHAICGAQEASADLFERSMAAQRTSETQSHIGNAMQKKVAELRMDNPIMPAIGKVKGFFKGALNSLADNFIPICFGSLALAAKNGFAKLGAWGVVGCALYKIVREGFGVGKETPINH